MESIGEVTKLAGELGELRATAKATEAKVDDLRASMVRLTEAMTAIVRLEVEFKQHTMAMDALRARQEMLDNRLDAMERDLPALKETRSWVVKMLSAAVSAVGAAVLAVVFIK